MMDHERLKMNGWERKLVCLVASVSQHKEIMFGSNANELFSIPPVKPQVQSQTDRLNCHMRSTA